MIETEYEEKEREERVKHFLELEKKYPTLFEEFASEKDDEKLKKDYPFTNGWMPSIPFGWRKAFGIIMLEELRLSMRPSDKDYVWVEAKEKYGEMRIYSGGGGRHLDRIVEKYCVLSGNICIDCGKPDVPMINGPWIYPSCSSCFKEKRNYDEAAGTGSRIMANTLTFQSWNNVIGGYEPQTMTISATAQLIRDFWKAKQEGGNV